jgi:hypothetical protein
MKNDPPEPFGYKIDWLAVRSDDPVAVAKSLGLKGKPAKWGPGVAKAYDRTHVFVSPSVKGWVLVVGGVISSYAADFEDTLKRLSHEFGQCQFFGNHRVSSYYAWAKAEKGKLVRFYAYGDSEVYEVGPTTAEEIDLDIGESDDDDYWPDEDDVMNIAGKWSLNPQELDGQPSAGQGLLAAKPK